ncbi:hypothetical protein VCRA2120E57_50063 [Vibrio crassostreae]|nr:hypothetical protein VCRA2120E57_50063 [Vibrio crassostreae]
MKQQRWNINSTDTALVGALFIVIQSLKRQGYRLTVKENSQRIAGYFCFRFL